VNVTLVSRPLPPVTSQTVWVGIRLARPPWPCSTIRNGSLLEDRGVHPDRSQRRLDAEAGAGADPGGVDPGQVEAAQKVVGEGRPQGEVGDLGEGPLTRDVYLDLGADRSHRGAILEVCRKVPPDHRN
jgi:hypothetical protein